MSVNNRRTFRKSGIFQDIYSRDRGQNEDIGGLQVGDRSTKWFNIGDAGAPTFGSPWLNYGGGWGPARYMRDAAGVVHLQGLIQAPVNGAGVAVFTLPEGFRPGVPLVFETIRVEGGVYQHAQFEVHPSGAVIEYNTVTNDSGITQWCTLSGISFPAEV